MCNFDIFAYLNFSYFHRSNYRASFNEVPKVTRRHDWSGKRTQRRSFSQPMDLQSPSLCCSKQVGIG